MEETGPNYSVDMQQDRGQYVSTYARAEDTFNGDGGAEEQTEFQEGDTSLSSRPCLPVSIHQMRKQQQETMRQAQVVENRINHLQRTEEQIWREMEDARRKAVTMELGKQRKNERIDVSHAIIESKNRTVLDKQVRVNNQKAESEAAKNEKTETRSQLAKRAGTMAREQTQANVQRKKAEQQRDRDNKAQKSLEMRKEREEARSRVLQEKEERIMQLRREQQSKCSFAQRDLANAGSHLNDLDQQEMACLDRLRLSLQLKQEAMQKIEASVGSSPVIRSLLSTKAMAKSTMFFADEVHHMEEDVEIRHGEADPAFLS